MGVIAWIAIIRVKSLILWQKNVFNVKRELSLIKEKKSA